MTLPIAIHRCDPSRVCPQASHCARFLDEDCDDRVHYVDASLTRSPKGCELFLDIRGAALMAPATQRRHADASSYRF